MEFKLIIAGGRDFDNKQLMLDSLHSLDDSFHRGLPVSFVSGMARGADALAYQLAKHNNIACHEFPADWDTYGKRAGFIRNEDMARFADGLLAFWDGQSKGTEHMIQTMKRMGKPVVVVIYTKE